jgi:hypothetical protein
MKKILWFLIGFSLIAFPLHYAYAGDCPSPHPGDLQAIFDHMQATAGSVCTDMAPTVADSYDEANNIYNAYVNSTSCNINALAYIRNGSVTGPSGYTIAARGWGGWDNVVFAAYYPDGCPPPYNPDADGDGIPDECDFYPNESDKNNDYKLLHATREDSSGILVSKYVKTSYGDFFRLGAEVPDNTPGYTDELYVSASYETYPSDCMYDISGSSESDFTDPVVYPGGTPDGTPGGTGIDPSMTDGESATGTETESEANTKIIDNTGATADNTAALGEYLKDMNKALQTIDKNIAMQGDAIGDGMDGIQSGLAEISEKMGDGSGDGEAAWDGIDGGSGWDDPQLTQITEGETGDYQAHGNLEDEGFITNFLTNNPIQQALDNSGFSLLNPVCEMSFDLGPLGSHTLSICEWDTEITMMGNLLFGITCLMSVMIVARGI